jgi:hypothetical protein
MMEIEERRRTRHYVGVVFACIRRFPSLHTCREVEILLKIYKKMDTLVQRLDKLLLASLKF